MAKYEPKTKATAVDPNDFIAGVADDKQREDARTLVALMNRLTGEPATMWGPSIIGFGTYSYETKGCKGEMVRIGFSPRKGQTVIYMIDGYEGKEAQLAKLGKHKLGKSCLYLKRLSDVDMGVLEEMMRESLAYMNEKYPH